LETVWIKSIVPNGDKPTGAKELGNAKREARFSEHA